MHEFLVSAAAFIVLVGVMVVVHEFGHFAVAKLCKVRVEAFSFGFGPRLFGFKYGETDYKVCLLPLGGFVKMTGENPGDNMELSNSSAARKPEDGQVPAAAPAENIEPDPGAFTSHPRWQSMLIGLAGPTGQLHSGFRAHALLLRLDQRGPRRRGDANSGRVGDSRLRRGPGGHRAGRQ